MAHPGGRRTRVLVLALVLLFAITAAAVVDHERKQDRLYAAQVEAWLCDHRGEQCGGPDWRAIERQWQHRELGYKAAFGLTAAGALVLLVRRRR